jgi:hypothetical protein
MHSRRLQYKDRWFCYLDLLGFTHLVRSREAGTVIALYEEAISKLEVGAAAKQSLGLSYSWFSDTFIIFTRGDSLEEFTWLEQASRLFFQRLLFAAIPARGAISHGKLYSNLEKNVFVGEALIEAYEYGEDQDWLGLLLVPSVYRKLEGTQLEVRERYNYRRVPANGVMRKLSAENVFAYIFNNATVNGSNPLLTAIRNMKRASPEPFRGKYERAEQFIAKHRIVATSE